MPVIFDPSPLRPFSSGLTTVLAVWFGKHIYFICQAKASCASRWHDLGSVRRVVFPVVRCFPWNGGMKEIRRPKPEIRNPNWSSLRGSARADSDLGRFVSKDAATTER